MKIHLDEQTVEVEAGAILVRFNVVEDVVATVEAPVVEETTETPAVEATEAVEPVEATVEAPVTEAATV